MTVQESHSPKLIMGEAAWGEPQQLRLWAASCMQKPRVLKQVLCLGTSVSSHSLCESCEAELWRGGRGCVHPRAGGSFLFFYRFFSF